MLEKSAKRRVSLYICQRIFQDDQIKMDGLSEACSKQGTEEKCVQNFNLNALREQTTWEIY
jgi:hypothetical protein